MYGVVSLLACASIHPLTGPTPTHPPSYGHQSQLLLLGCPRERFMVPQQNREDLETIVLDDDDDEEEEDKKRGAGGGAGLKRAKKEK